MLPSSHSSSSSSSSSLSSSAYNMDRLSVLDRQKALLQRHYHQQQSHSDHLNESHFWQNDASLIHRALSGPEITISNCNNIARVPVPKPDWQCNSSLPNREGNGSCSVKKRKAEFDVEDETKDGRVEVEEEKSEITTKAERETSANTSSKVSEVQKPDYIHVRARRGQATDSHSLAERARREKISKKMKCLQDLVPGCNKMTGKAEMLDEIINYVQSLQKQVEFLSMKLAAINPRLEFSIDNFLAKEISTYIESLQAAAATQFEANNSIFCQYNCGADTPMDQSPMLPQKAPTSSMPIPEMFLDSSSIPQLQQLSGWESDWPSLPHTGFH
ncbi:hypothetical protein CDL12_23249 [Handroanthus impetiginosus]|uniref:BHLH domain-containing protein n=1 Tax=Handroanthus impetiginosus TaxID=429701 RepID=A0A2G9GGR6_9LAMI|nr:hypothetical protein CDL12_23249 [Handroanthus impetiginosus]